MTIGIAVILFLSISGVGSVLIYAVTVHGRKIYGWGTQNILDDRGDFGHESKDAAVIDMVERLDIAP